MKRIYNVSGMTCNGCKSSVEKSLNNFEKIDSATVDLDKKEAVVKSKGIIPLSELQEAIGRKYTITEKENTTPVSLEDENKSTIKQLFPLFLIFSYILVTSILLNRKPWRTNEFMFDFMGLFYIVFSFFKFLDVKGFAMSFMMYDPLAKRFSFYGFVYPFIELALGLLFLFRYQTQIALILTLVILGLTTIGVTKSLVDKKAIKCACLGSVLNLPMTKATFIENSIMIVMAIYMLI